MRVMAKISLPVEAANQAIRDHRLGSVMQRAAERWRPEAMYFTTFDGQRTAFMVFDMPTHRTFRRSPSHSSWS